MGNASSYLLQGDRTVGVRVLSASETRDRELRIRETLQLPVGATLEFGGLYQQQQESFKNLAFVLLMATFLVFAVLLVEFRSVIQPLAIVSGVVLALFGVVAAPGLTGTSLNIVSFLGAIIGVGAGADMLRPLAIAAARKQAPCQVGAYHRGRYTLPEASCRSLAAGSVVVDDRPRGQVRATLLSARIAELHSAGLYAAACGAAIGPPPAKRR